MMSLYDLIWGQCSEALRSRLRGHDDFASYSPDADSIALLKGIRAEMTGFSIYRPNPVMSPKFCNIFQVLPVIF